MMNRRQAAANAKQATGAAQVMQIKGEAIMKSLLSTIFAVLVLAGIAAAKEMPKDLPDAPSAAMTAEAFIVAPPVAAPVAKVAESKTIDLKFTTLAIISTGSTFADSYTTLFARQNFLAGKQGVCNVEVESAYLYGAHPTVGRAYAVASAKSAASVIAAYYLRKHHNRFWSIPLVANSVVSLQGVTQNMRACN
jgi:hypothetical protein